MNPFEGLGKPVSPERIMGRDTELQELIRALSSFSTNVSLVGQPRIGKSSLASAARVGLPEGPNHVVVETHMSSSSDSRQFFRDLFDLTAEAWEALGHPRSTALHELMARTVADSDEGYRRVRRGMQLLARAGAKTLWIIDEFDKVTGFFDSRDTILRLRELIYQHHEYQSCALIVSRRTIATIEGQVPGVSNLSGVVPHVRFLGPLDRAALERIADRCRPGWELSPEERDRLWWLTGGQPYLAELLLYYGWPECSLEQGLRRASTQLLDHYEDLEDLHKEDGLFAALVQVAVGPRWSAGHKEVSRLRAYGLIDPARDNRAFSDHYQEYFERCQREGVTLDLWRETEVAARDTIEEVLCAKLGREWESLIGQDSKLKDTFDDARAKQEKDQRSFGQSSSRLLDYLYPMGLWSIIETYWSDFSAMLPVKGLQGNHKHYWRQRFELFARVRNPTMHHRDEVIPRSTITTAGGYCQQILEALRKAPQSL